MVPWVQHYNNKNPHFSIASNSSFKIASSKGYWHDTGPGQSADNSVQVLVYESTFLDYYRKGNMPNPPTPFPVQQYDSKHSPCEQSIPQDCSLNCYYMKVE